MPEKHPRISIITPCFNDAAFLEYTLSSISRQDYPELEYIIIDGGSTDGSVDIIKQYEDKIAYWESARDEGLYDALQKGFERSTGEIMGWINSDDIHQPGSLFTIGQIFQDYSQVNWIQGVPNIIDEKNRIVNALPGNSIDKYYFYRGRHIHTHRFIQQESTFWRRSLWEKAGARISREYKYAADFELWIRFFLYEKLYNVPALLGSFRSRGKGQLSVEHLEEYLAETLEILKRYPLSREETKKMRRLELYNRLEKKLKLLGDRVKTRWDLSKDSTVNGKISFDYRLQKFKM